MNRFNSSMLLLISSFSLLCLSSSAFAMAGKPEVVLPDGVLNASQIEQLVLGKTVAVSTKDKGLDLVLFFRADGRMKQVRDGWQSDGTWSVREDGRLCTKTNKSGRDCDIIVKEAGQYSLYTVKKDGNHHYEMTFATFRNGEQLAQLSQGPLLPAGTLNRKQIVELFSGKTVESVTAAKGRVSQSHYSPDGALEQYRTGVKRHGQWRVNKNARMCLQLDNLEEKCRIIVKEDGAIKKYIVKKNGRHQHSVSYRNFTPGKNFK